MDNYFLGVTLLAIIILLVAHVDLQRKNKNLRYRNIEYRGQIDKLMLDMQDMFLGHQEEKQFLLREREFNVAVIELMKRGDNYATARRLVSEHFRVGKEVTNEPS